MFDTILVAVDDSDQAQAAIDLACKLAKLDGAKLLLVNAVDASKLLMVAGYETPYPVDAVQLLREEGRELLDTVQASCEARGLSVATVACEGDACDEILRIAREDKVGLICMGTHGRKGLSHLFVGSVAEGVVQRSTVPVLVTK
ncbi:MAG TPA: universal stress protein [Verrucomicrobiae bacterium]|nr:universal stress protein [Verrucomicrobiae bacterium]HTZ56200.1 universal stress protein [Candidatus Acidoferrum sp.]